jgi:hypothetical protein
MKSTRIIGILVIIIIFLIAITIKISSSEISTKKQQLWLKYEYAKIQSKIDFIPWKTSAIKVSWIVSIVAPATSLFLFCIFSGIARMRTSSIVSQRVGEHSEIKMHYSLVKLPEMVQLTAGMIQAESLKTEHPERYVQFADKVLNHVERLTNREIVQNNSIASIAKTSQKNNTPDFKKLIETKEIAPGKPLLIGYTQDGNQCRSSLEDNYSTVVIGQSGTGKTTGEAYSIASTILAYGAFYTILDPHYPDKKKESLGDRLGVLKGLENIRIFNNPCILDNITEQLDAEFELFKATGQGRTPHIIVVDEHALWKNSSNGGKELLKFEEKIIYEGRKYGWYLHVTSKSPLAQDFGTSAVRDNFVTSLVYKVRKKQAQTYFADTDLVELVQSCDKPGMAVYTDRHDKSQILSIPQINEHDMRQVYNIMKQSNGNDIIIHSQNHPGNDNMEIRHKVSETGRNTAETSVYESVKKYIVEKGITQNEFASFAGISPKDMSHFMTKKTMTDERYARIENGIKKALNRWPEKSEISEIESNEGGNEERNNIIKAETRFRKGS